MKYLKTFALILAIALLASCKKTDEQATGIGDAVIIVKKSGSETVYGLSLYAYTYSTFQSVQAVSTADPGKTYTLKAYQGNKSDFYYETPETSYTNIPPAVATINFTAAFENGMKGTFQDELTDKILGVPIIDTCQYISATHVLRLTWGAVTDAYSYSVNIFDGTNQVFGSVELSNTIHAFSISTVGYGWLPGFTPVSGKTYIVKVNAFLFETPGDAFNVQAISIADSTAVWGN